MNVSGASGAAHATRNNTPPQLFSQGGVEGSWVLGQPKKQYSSVSTFVMRLAMRRARISWQ